MPSTNDIQPIDIRATIYITLKKLRVKALRKNKQGYEAGKCVCPRFLLAVITEKTQSIRHLKNDLFSETTAPIL